MSATLTINKIEDGETLTVQVVGRVDTVTSPQLEEAIKESISGVTELIFDMSELQYISSAGLRVLLSAQKVMNDQGSMLVRGVGEEIMEIFDVTGFTDILKIEE